MADDQELLNMAYEYVNNVLQTWDNYDDALRYLVCVHTAIGQYMDDMEAGDDELPGLQ